MICKVFKRIVLVVITLLVVTENASAQGLVHQTVNSGGGVIAHQAGYLSISLGGAVDASFQNAFNQGFQQGGQPTVDLAVDIEVLTEEGQAPFANVEFFRITVTNVGTATATNINLAINLELPEGANSNLNSLNLVIPQLGSGQTSELVLTIGANEYVHGQMNNVHVLAEVIGANEIVVNTENDTQEAYASILNCKTSGISIDYHQSSGCAGEAISFTANETTFDSYQWFVDGAFIGSNQTIAYAPLSSVTMEVIGTIAACTVSAVEAITISNYDFNVVGDKQVCPNSTLEFSVAANHTDAGTYSWTYVGSSGTLVSEQGETIAVQFGNEITAEEKVLVQYISSSGCVVSKEHGFELSNFCDEGDMHQTVNSGGASFINSSNGSYLVVSVGGAVNASFMQTTNIKLNQGFLQTEDKPCEQSTNLLSTVYNDNAVKLNWSNDNEVLSHTLRYKSVSETSWSEINSSNSEVIIAGANLTLNTQYEWYVLTHCTESQSAESELNAFTTKNTAVCSAPSNLSVANVTETSAYLVWSGSPGKTYRIRYMKAIGDDVWKYKVVTGATTVKISNLISGTHYRWQIVTVCDDGAYVPVSFTTLNHVFATNGNICQTPTNRREVLTGNNVATLLWNSVEGAVKYNIRYTETANTNWKYVETTNTAFQLPPLLPSTSYKWAVMTFCEVNASLRSTNEFFVTNPPSGMRVGDMEMREITIFPNPFDDYITVSLPSNLPHSVTIQLIDVNGIIIYEDIRQASGYENIVIDAEIAAGVYFVKISDLNGILQSERIVKL